MNENLFYLACVDIQKVLPQKKSQLLVCEIYQNWVCIYDNNNNNYYYIHFWTLLIVTRQNFSIFQAA